VQALADGYRPALVLYERDAMEKVLSSFDLVVAIMAVGIVVRRLCGRLQDKWTDRPVVAVDSSLRCAVPLVGGHHGANELALRLAERLGLFPAITTATEAAGRPCLESAAAKLGADIMNKESSKAVNLAFLKESVPILRLKGPKIVVVDKDVAVLKVGGLVVGVGARKGVRSSEVLEAIDAALAEAGRNRDEVTVLATAWLKRDEKGLAEAAQSLGLEVLYLSDEVINAQAPTTPSRASDLGLSGVAEPAVLALATKLIMPKRAYGRVTVAIGE
jgi:cobalt-precorrin 5A hydrolase